MGGQKRATGWIRSEPELQEFGIGSEDCRASLSIAAILRCTCGFDCTCSWRECWDT